MLCAQWLTRPLSRLELSRLFSVPDIPRIPPAALGAHAGALRWWASAYRTPPGSTGKTKPLRKEKQPRATLITSPCTAWRYSADMPELCKDLQVNYYTKLNVSHGCEAAAKSHCKWGTEMISHILSYTMCLRKPPPYRFYCLRLGWNLGGEGEGVGCGKEFYVKTS